MATLVEVVIPGQIVVLDDMVHRKEPLSSGERERCDHFMTFYLIIYFYFYDLAI